VELARLAYERYNRGDIDGFLELCEPSFEFRDVPEVPGSGVYIGHDGYRRWHRGMLDAFEDLRFEGIEFIDAGDQVVVAARGVARGKGSGASVEMDYSNVFKIKEGKIISLRSYNTHAEALEAAGLSE
jgi:ketosteroid isomerase-like protein